MISDVQGLMGSDVPRYGTMVFIVSAQGHRGLPGVDGLPGVGGEKVKHDVSHT